MSMQSGEYMFDDVQITEYYVPAVSMKSSRKETIRTSNEPEDGPEVEIDVKRLADNLEGFFYSGDTLTPSSLTLEAFLDTMGRTVVFKVQSLKGLEELMEEAVVEVAGAYREMSLGTAIGEDCQRTSEMPPERFCVGLGAIELPYRTIESAQVGLIDYQSSLKITLETESTIEPTEENLIVRLDNAMPDADAMGVEIDRIRAGERELAGMLGTEVVIRLSGDDSTELHFNWEFPGDVDSGARPEIGIGMVTPDANLEDWLGTWDRLLDSLKPLR